MAKKDENKKTEDGRGQEDENNGDVGAAKKDEEEKDGVEKLEEGEEMEQL